MEVKLRYPQTSGHLIGFGTLGIYACISKLLYILHQFQNRSPREFGNLRADKSPSWLSLNCKPRLSHSEPPSLSKWAHWNTRAMYLWLPDSSAEGLALRIAKVCDFLVRNCMWRSRVNCRPFARCWYKTGNHSSSWLSNPQPVKPTKLHKSQLLDSLLIL
jgi:hypothetical protein